MSDNLNLQYFTLEVKKHVAIFTLQRPEVRNALNEECYLELMRFVDYAQDCDDIRVIIITGAGDKAFAAGADIRMLNEMSGVTSLKGIAIKAMVKMEECTKPIIAAVNGIAFGGGFEMALASDIRVVSENAKFGLPETNLGVLPGAGGTQNLARMIGVGRTKEVVMAGRVLNADEAVEYGLALKKVPLDQLMDAAMEVAETLMKKGPVALALSKKIINMSMHTDVKTGLFVENLAFSMLTETQDRVEGTAAFLEKRPPNFQGK